MAIESSEIREFAEQVLCGTRLADKLVRPQRITDLDPRPKISLPLVPVRPSDLSFGTNGRVVKSFPTAGRLDDDRQRGLVLHYFANHELLALELMALCLLKFPAAPAAFRRGLVATMWEEQEHLQLYQSRMQELGVFFGEFPLNQYFWRATADVRSPLAFVATMSLTLEQANLDFSLYYLQVFRQMGDAVSASIMERVYREEIGHVAHGLGWFGKWRDGKRSAWTEYCALLDHPLTPRRAKGKIFDVAGRRAAGFDDDFIQKLSVYSSSRGRPPHVYLFDPGVESSLAGHSPKPAQTVFRQDFSHIMMFLAAEDDVVLVDRPHGDQHFSILQALGYRLPERVVPAGESVLAKRQWSSFEPWGISPDVLRRLGRIRQEQTIDPAIVRALSDKSLARGQRQTYVEQTGDPLWCDEPTWAATTLKQVESALVSIAEKGFELALLKAPLGASGQNMKRHVALQPLPDNFRGWIEKVIRRQGCLLVEPWLGRCADFGIQIDTRARDPYLGWTLYFTTETGRIRGYYLGHKLSVLTPEIRRALHQGCDGGLAARGRHLAQFTQKFLQQNQYAGPAGIDCFLYHKQQTVVGRPLVEINVRYSMGHIALKLEKKLAPGASGIWYWLFPEDVRNLGYQNFSEFATAMQQSRPAQRGGDGIASGVFFTNDPGQAIGTLGMVWVAPGNGSPAECLSRLAARDQTQTL